MAWAWAQQVPSTTKHVLLALADHADDEGICWPGIKGVARKTGIKDRMVQRHISRLVSLGLLSVEPQTRPDGGRGTNRYALKMYSVTPTPSTIVHPPGVLNDTTPVYSGTPLESSLEPSLGTDAESDDSASLRADAQKYNPTPPTGLEGFHAALVGVRGYEPSEALWRKVLPYVEILDLEAEALAIAGWCREKRTKGASAGRILNWLKRSANGPFTSRAPPAKRASPDGWREWEQAR